MSFAFKKFNFFEQDEQKGHNFPLNAVCWCEGPGYLLVGCDNGQIQLLDSGFQLITAFSAHSHKVLFLFWLHKQHLLLSVGVEEPGVSSATMKLWDIEKVQGQANPKHVKSTKIFNAKYPESEVTAIAVKEGGLSNLTVAVGLGSGWVYIFQGDVSAKGKLHHSQKVAVRPEQSDLWCVTGLALQGQAEILTLFVLTESQTLSIHLHDGTKTLLDASGVRAGGCCLQRPPLVVVARDDALYDYAPDTRAGCTAFEGRKQQLLALRRYLVVVTGQTTEDGVATSTIWVADVRNKLVSASFTHPNVQLAFTFNDKLHILLGSGRLLSCREAELGVQLEALFKRSLYKLALGLAWAEGAAEGVVAGVHQRWGDHLYGKGEYDAAMAQYLETVGQLEASYVIRRFLDAQRIHNLTSYLELLHQQGLASAEHTTLLLNCYTKLKAVEKLDAFVQRGAQLQLQQQQHSNGVSDSNGSTGQGGGADGRRGGGARAQELNFDAETAVKVLRGAGYFEHALWVAGRAKQPGWELDILLGDMADHRAAAEFIGGLPRPEKAAALRKYGRALIGNCPEEATALLMDICSPQGGDESSPAGYVASIADFAHLYADKPTSLLLLCEFVLNSQPSPPSQQLLYHTLLQLYLTTSLPDEPNPLGTSPEDTSISLEERHSKALELLGRGWAPHMEEPCYDPQQALVLCRIHHFRAGLLLLYDRLRLPRECLQVHMQAGDGAGLIAACVKYGDSRKGGDPHLWADCLHHFCSQSRDCTPQICEVLEHIERERVLPLLVVVQALMRKGDLRLGVVQDYVQRQLQREASQVAEDRQAVAKLQQETAALRTEVHKLRTEPKVFQNSRCSVTGQPLELPVLHFLCGHSFNLKSLGENEAECPLCAPDFRRILDIRRNMRTGAMNQDKFFTELRESEDGFSVVAHHFGRGLMNLTAASSPAP